MKISSWQLWGLALAVGASTVVAEDASDVTQLKQQLTEMKAAFERTQQQQREQIEALQRQVEALQQRQSADADKRKLEHELAKELAPPVAASAPPPAAASRAWQPSDPIRISRGGTYMDIGLVGTFAAGGTTAKDVGALQSGGHDPNQRGFTVQGVEANFAGAVDPYFRANANILWSIDADNESFLEVEEAWMETTSLPANLQVRGGQFLTEFGRVNTQHPHSWAFVDSPLVNARFLGPDGLRNPGARLSWLTPLPFYSELFLSVQNSQGGTAASFRNELSADDVPLAFRPAANDRGVAGAGDLLFAPHWANSFELTDSQTLLAGVSAAFGPNPSGGSGDTRTEIYGVDLTWKWKSPRHHGGFPFVSFQTEAMLRRYQAGAYDWTGTPAGEPLALAADGVTPAALPRETLTDYGLYSQALWGFAHGWVAGLRGEFLTGDRADYEQRGLLWQDASGAQTAFDRDPNRNSRWRVSPNLTWYPSEFSKLRLQYNYDDRQGIGVDHSVWLQFEFLLGAHAAHKF